MKTMIVFLAAAMIGSHQDLDKADKEWDKLNGSWVLTTFKYDGELVPIGSPTRVEIKDGKVTIEEEGSPPTTWLFAINADKNPKTATAMFEGLGRVMSVAAIYSVSGNELKFCFNLNRADVAEKVRPTKFNSPGSSLYILRKNAK